VVTDFELLDDSVEIVDAALVSAGRERTSESSGGAIESVASIESVFRVLMG
jgi:hypothetical protein